MKQSKATEALRVATDIAAIRAALNKRGYRLRKQPKQAAWKIIVTPDHCYKLTYQPTPISAWVLHPQNNDTRRHVIENIIQSAIKKQPHERSALSHQPRNFRNHQKTTRQTPKN